MPSLNEHEGSEYVKGIVLGDPGSGKTGALTSLVSAGYKLRIWDFDNLLNTLVQYVRKECPQNIGNVSYQTFTDKLKGVDMPLTMIGNSLKVMPNNDGTPTAYVKGLKQLNAWKTEDEDFGKPETWGADTVVVIDSLTSLSNAAFRYVQAMNPMAKEPQTYYFGAQQLIMNLLQLLCTKDFATNVLVLAHLTYKENQLELTKGFPRTVGSALNEVIAAHFNTVLLVESTNSRREIRTRSTGIVDLKNPMPFSLPEKLPIESGLADYFRAVLNPEK